MSNNAYTFQDFIAACKSVDPETKVHFDLLGGKSNGWTAGDVVEKFVHEWEESLKTETVVKFNGHVITGHVVEDGKIRFESPDSLKWSVNVPIDSHL